MLYDFEVQKLTLIILVALLPSPSINLQDAW